VLGNYDDRNYSYTGEHPKIEGVAYFDKHVQPSKDTCIRDLIRNVNILIFSLHTIKIGIWRVSGGLLEEVIIRAIHNWWFLI
jgi:hypothetical protein